MKRAEMGSVEKSSAEFEKTFVEIMETYLKFLNALDRFLIVGRGGKSSGHGGMIIGFLNLLLKIVNHTIYPVHVCLHSTCPGSLQSCCQSVLKNKSFLFQLVTVQYDLDQAFRRVMALPHDCQNRIHEATLGNKSE